MIISRTPYRISFFGGGTDYPQWYKNYGGEVVSTTINRYLYLSCRYLPTFFDHKYRIVYSKIENVNNVEDIKHKAIRRIFKHLEVNKGIELHYDGGLPARSGMASSSAFIVGLINLLSNFENKKISKINLARKSIYIEQNILKEVVGSQDQVATALGGFNRISFLKDGDFRIKNYNNEKNKSFIKNLNKNLILLYSGIERTASEIAETFVNKLNKSKKREMGTILDIVKESQKLITSSDVDGFGKLLNESWKVKKSLSYKVSNKKIDDIYNYALENGALGGKILGAGGGGFFIFYVKKNNQKVFLQKFNKFIQIPFSFENKGSSIIFKENDDKGL